MNADEPILTEIEIQNTFLFSKVGVHGSGAVRYGAAMYFYNQKLLSPEMLEIYRRCCKFDNEDPIDLARFESIQDIPNSNLGT